MFEVIFIYFHLFTYTQANIKSRGIEKAYGVTCGHTSVTINKITNPNNRPTTTKSFSLWTHNPFNHSSDFHWSWSNLEWRKRNASKLRQKKGFLSLRVSVSTLKQKYKIILGSCKQIVLIKTLKPNINVMKTIPSSFYPLLLYWMSWNRYIRAYGHELIGEKTEQQ